MNWAAAAAAIVAVSAACYANTVSDGGFVYDDAGSVVGNGDVLGRTTLAQLVQHDFWGKPLTEFNSHRSWRPVTVLSFRLDHWLAGGLEPGLFHATNVLLHAAASLLLLAVAGDVFALDVAEAAAAALLFAAHPVHTEAVSNITGRADVLCAVLLLASLLCYRRAAHAKGTTPAWYATACGLVMAATLCKETGITAFGVLAAYEAIYVWGMAPPPGKQWRHLAVRWVGFCLCGAVYAYARVVLCDGAPLSPKFSSLDNPMIGLERLPLILHRAYNHAYYFFLLVFPLQLSADYSAHCLPVVETIDDPRNAASLAVYGLLAALVLAGFVHRDAAPYRNGVWLAVAMLVVPFLPSSNYVMHIGTFIGERLLYVPSAGYCLLVGCAVRHARQRGWLSTSGLMLALVFVLALFGGRTVLRNDDWQSDRALMAAAHKVCPNSARVWYIRGVQDLKRANYEDAHASFEQALDILDDYAWAHWRIAKTHYQLGRLASAERHLLRAIELRWTFPAQLDLGTMYAMHDRRDRAVPMIESYVKGWKPNDAKAVNNLAIALGMNQQLVEAAEAFNHALSRQGDQATRAYLLSNAAAVTFGLGGEPQREQALKSLALAQTTLPDDQSIKHNAAAVERGERQGLHVVFHVAELGWRATTF